MDAEEALRLMGGTASIRPLLELTTWSRLRSGVATGRVIRVAKGRYAVADVDAHRRRAAELSGVLSHLDAALHHGWAVKDIPNRAWVTVPRNRKVTRAVQRSAHVVYADLAPHEISGATTTGMRTVLDCARRLPFDEALAVADSALRSGKVTSAGLTAAASSCRGPGSAQVRLVAMSAHAAPANPFESVLRALVISVGGFELEVQGFVEARGWPYHPDLLDRSRRIVIEADSWTFHGKERRAWERDVARYTAFAADGWVVLRFTWWEVMRHPAYVCSVLEDVRDARPPLRSTSRRPSMAR